MKSINEIEAMMGFGMTQLKKSIDLSVIYLQEDPSQKNQINTLWENFLFDIVEYIRQTEKDTGEDLIKGIPIMKLIKLLR